MKTMEYVDEFNVKGNSKGSWVDVCYANIIVALSLGIALFLSPISLALVVLAFIYLEIGLQGFVLKLMRKEKAGYEELFISPKLFLKALALKLVYLASIMLWAMLLIVPGIIVALNYAFVSLVFVENPDMDIREILQRSKALMTGCRIKVMLVFLCALLLTCVGVAAGFGISALIGLAVQVPVWAMVLLMVFFGGIVTMFLSLPLYETYLCSCYLAAKTSEEIRKNKKSSAKTVKKVVNKN